MTTNYNKRESGSNSFLYRGGVLSPEGPLWAAAWGWIPWLLMLVLLETLGLAGLGRTGMMLVFLSVAVLVMLFLLIRLLPVAQGWNDPGLWLPQALSGALLMLVVIHLSSGGQQLLLLLAALPWLALHGLAMGTLRTGLVLALMALGYMLPGMFGWLRETPPDAMQLSMESLAFLLSASGMLIALVAYELKGEKRSGGNLRRDLKGVSQPRLLNRDELLEVMVREVARAKRKKVYFSVALMELDELNRLHLEQGQATVDALHKAFAQCMLDRARQMDVVGRRSPGDGPIGGYQGREFIAVLPATPIRGGISFANRIRHAMENQKIRFRGASWQPSVSAGVAEYRDGESLDALLGRAESALHRAQRLGRGRVERETAGGA